MGGKNRKVYTLTKIRILFGNKTLTFKPKISYCDILIFLHTGILHLLEHGEEYTFSLPCAYARSILTVPWVELGGKVNINCAKTGYSASINFHTKPFYGGKLHR
uniref:Uncharacterized protein n=1 Tax=Cyanistes caeruleus TaxID=156563 RepID=A0A8C0UFP0_CYACU